MKPLKPLKWEPTLYQRLAQLIQDHAQPQASDPSQRAYMVFDFDETCITGDIEDHFMTYLVDHFAFKLDPDQLRQVLTCQPEILNRQLPGQAATLQDLVDELLISYQEVWLQKNKGQAFPQPQDPHYQDLAAKLTFYYFTAMRHMTFAPNQWISTYFFTGFTQDDMTHHVQAMLKDPRYQTRQVRHWTSLPDPTGLIGPIEVSYQAGMVFCEEMINLFQALISHGIDPYIVSASPLPLVEAVVAQSPLSVLDKSQIYAMQTQFNPAGQILNQLDPTAHTSHGPGKSQVIRDWISPRHQGKSPLAIFGDSMGDYDMLTQFGQTTTRVLFNRHLNDPTQDLAQEAKLSYGQADAKYFLQGKDYRTGQFLNQIHSIFA